MNQLAQLGTQTKELWQKLDKKIKWLAIILSASIFLTLVGLSIWGNSSQLSPLFYDLDPADASQIMAKLQEDQIPFQLEDGGKTILVPADQVDSLRITLSASGVLSGGVVGNELFDQTKWGITDFEQQQRYKRALEGELVRSIRTLDGIKDARVHLVLPEPSPFLEEENTATASVVLTLEPYSKVATDQIKGIANFLAGAVPGLSPKNVTIMDGSWNVLSDSSVLEAGQTTKPNTQLELKREIDRELELSLQSMLERIFGFGNAIVRVSSDVAFDYKETTAERYEPVNGSKGIVRSEQKSSETQTGTSSQVPMGVAGISSNIPGYTINNNTQDSSSYERADSIINYEISKVLEHHIAAPGTVTRLSVAVWLHGDIDEATKTKVRETVAAASGIDFARGDQLTVENLPFYAANNESLPQTELAQAQNSYSMVYIGLGVLALILILVVTLRGRAKKKQEDTALLEMAAVADKENEIEVKEDPRVTLEKDIKILARQKPEEIAKVLQSWLADEQ